MWQITWVVESGLFSPQWHGIAGIREVQWLEGRGERESCHSISFCEESVMLPLCVASPTSPSFSPLIGLSKFQLCVVRPRVRHRRHRRPRPFTFACCYSRVMTRRVAEVVKLASREITECVRFWASPWIVGWTDGRRTGRRAGDRVSFAVVS